MNLMLFAVTMLTLIVAVLLVQWWNYRTHATALAAAEAAYTRLLDASGRAHPDPLAPAYLGRAALLLRHAARASFGFEAASLVRRANQLITAVEETR